MPILLATTDVRFDAKEKRVTVCLVHGNPETAAVWNRLAPLLDRGPVVRLSPPGFGAPVPPRFTATVEEYRRWLVTELERFGQPVHLVGHDWGLAMAEKTRSPCLTAKPGRFSKTVTKSS